LGLRRTAGLHSQTWEENGRGKVTGGEDREVEGREREGREEIGLLKRNWDSGEGRFL